MLKCNLCYLDFDESRLLKSKKCNQHSYCIKCRSFLKSRHPENLLPCKDCNNHYKSKTKERFGIIAQYFDKSCSECKKKQNKCSRVCKKHNICFFCLNKSFPSYEANKTQQCYVCLEVLTKACRICSLILSEKDINYRSPCIIHIYCTDCITKKNDYTKCNNCLNYRPIEDTSRTLQYKKNRPTQIHFDSKRTFEVTGDYELNNPIEIRKFYSPKNQGHYETSSNSKSIHSQSSFKEYSHQENPPPPLGGISQLTNHNNKPQIDVYSTYTKSIDNPGLNQQEINSFNQPQGFTPQYNSVTSDNQSLVFNEPSPPQIICQKCNNNYSYILECNHPICISCINFNFRQNFLVFLNLLENKRFDDVNSKDFGIHCPGMNTYCCSKFICPFMIGYVEELLISSNYSFDARGLVYTFGNYFDGIKVKFLECKSCRAVVGCNSNITTCFKCGFSLE